MKVVPLTITALGPLAFPERKPGVQFRASLPYVPGSAIYGALGMLLADTISADAFAELFRKIRCHNAYPVLGDDAWSRPLPMTALQPKGGKAAPAHSGDRNGELGPLRLPYEESLYGRVCWEQQQPPALIYAPADAEGRPWEAAKRAFYALENPQSQAWRPGDALEAAGIGVREVFQRVLTRVSINRRRGTAEDGRLYSPLVINEVMEGRDKQLTPTRFRGSITLFDDEQQVEQQVLGALAEITHVGGRQTTGLGAVEIQPLPAVSLAEATAALRQRIATMSSRFREQAQLYRTLGGAEWNTGTIFTVNLLSDALLFEQGWLPTNELSAAMLKEATTTRIEATLVRSFTTTASVGGWNVSWQRPKPTAVATTMGSLFVFQAAGELSDADYAALALLEYDGIGERRAEGFGQVRICDEIHLLSPELPQEEA